MHHFILELANLARENRRTLVVPAVVVLVVIAALASSCLGLEETTIDLRFVNESDDLLCYHQGPEAAASGEYCAEVKPNKTSTWRPGCDPTKTQPQTVILTLGRGGRQLYRMTATCNEWEESGGRIVIEERGGEYIVTDGL